MIKLQASSVRMLLQIEGKTNIAVFVDTYTDAEILESFNELLYLIPCSSQKIKFSIENVNLSVENVNLSHFYPNELFFIIIT